ncbi:MAG: hypothetical protein N3B18_05350, partial [Desulfobacterota bacterium]|nr:hypothetical protein [Thermodesulfobacteriota bacterium]
MTDHDLHLAEKLRATGALEPIDIQFAQFLCRLAGDSASSELFWAAALASNVTQNEKHVCL